MSITLSTKERNLLEDQKTHEQICIEKYTNYSNQAQDPQLKKLFTDNANSERQHLNSINSLLSGEIPNTSGGSNASTAASQQGNAAASASQVKSGMTGTGDSDFCTDMLMTEKYVSGAYDTAIFEFRDKNARDVLNHIQKEEQQHGESIYNYMASKGMYKVQ
ncbi:spore coat protein [Clostridium sp. LBM24168]